ncbi:CPBP family intramembrane metalloprotease [bacterium]|nr:CPBP family intramembrane metalloprotease [bacterium]
MPLLSPDDYVSAAQTVAQLSALGAVVGASIWMMARPQIVGQWLVGNRPVRRSLVAGVTLMVLGSVCAALAVWVGGVEKVFMTRTLGTWVMLAAAACALPAAFDMDRRSRKGGLPPKPVWQIGILAGTGAVIIVSLLWFWVAGLLFNVQGTEVFAGLLVLGWQFPTLVILALLAAPIEELIFRGALQGLLERICARFGWPAWLAVVAAAALWALGHAGMVTPDGIKEGQILAIGLMLGFARRRFGLEGAIAIHLGLNMWTLLMQFALNLLGLGAQ